MSEIEYRGNVVELRSSVDSWVDMLGPVGDLASKIARTPFVPKAMQNNPAAVAAAILTGRELDLGPMTSLRGIDVIDGRPSLSAQLLAARILAAGHRIDWKESTDNRCTVSIERADGLSSAVGTFSMADAKRAGLDTKSNWSKYPRAMLRARALTEAAGMACPDVALGLDTAAQPEQVPGAAAVSAAPTVTVQLNRPETLQEAPRSVEASPVDSTTDELDDDDEQQEQEQQQEQDDAPITTAQQRHLRAILGDMQRAAGKRLTADEQRDVIAQHAGMMPGTLDSSKHLTVEQAQRAIHSLQEAREVMLRNIENR